MDAAFGFAARYASDHPNEAAERLEGLTPGDVASFLEDVDAATAAKLLGRIAPPIAGSFIEVMNVEAVAEVLPLVSVDQCVRALRHVSSDRRTEILHHLPEKLSTTTRRILRFPDGSAGAIADGSVRALPSDMTVEAALQVARDPRIAYVYVVDRDHRLVGVAHKHDLEASGKSVHLREILAPAITRIPANASITRLRRHRAWRVYDALPVVDGRGVYLGAIRHKDLRSLGEPPVAVGGSGPPLATFIELSELYWVGLASMVAGLSAGTKSGRGKELRDGR